MLPEMNHLVRQGRENLGRQLRGEVDRVEGDLVGNLGGIVDVDEAIAGKISESAAAYAAT